MSIEEIKYELDVLIHSPENSSMIHILHELLKEKQQYENLKCCGNCEYTTKHIICDKNPDNWCPKWLSDGLTKQDREV
jgi:hypothetical protein